MTITLDSTRSAVVIDSIKWIPIDEHTPIGAKCLVIDKQQGISYLREYRHGYGWTHWHPLPRFEK